jgi:hypothetical protein
VRPEAVIVDLPDDQWVPVDEFDTSICRAAVSFAPNDIQPTALVTFT